MPSDWEQKVEDARAAVSRLCHGEDWRMCIPVNPDTDHDVIICDGLKAATDHIADLAREKAELEAERSTCPDCNAVYLDHDGFGFCGCKEDERIDREQREKLAELEAVVGKLPKTKDGVVMIPQSTDTLWKIACDGRVIEVDAYFWLVDEEGDRGWCVLDAHSESVGGIEHFAEPVSSCYSTKAAAQAAAEGATDNG